MGVKPAYRVIALLLVWAIIPYGGSLYSEPAGQVTGNSSVISTGLSKNPASDEKNAGKILTAADPLNPYAIMIPKEYGTIGEVFQAAKNAPLIIHIQNAHANYEAQMNINKILNDLVSQYQLSLVLTEGAVSQLDPEILKPSYLEEANLKLVDYLLREGRITGADAFAVETKQSVEFYGIEDQALYTENLKIFRQIFQDQKEMGPYFQYVRSLIRDVGNKLLSRPLLQYVSKRADYLRNPDSLMDYLEFLNSIASKTGIIPLNDFRSGFDYPNLYRLIKMAELDGRMDANQLKREREQLALEMNAKLPALDFRSEKLGQINQSGVGEKPRRYFAQLNKLARKSGIDLLKYPQIGLWAEYLVLQDDIEHEDVFTEILDFDRMLEEKLFTGEDQKKYLKIIDSVHLLDQYFCLKMTRQELAQYLKNEAQMKPSWIAGQLEAMAEHYGISTKPLGEPGRYDPYLQKLEYFYQLVLKRDEIFMDRINDRMRSTGQNRAIVITGGFHEDGLADQYRKKNISFVIVKPKVDVNQGSENYTKIMMGQDSVIGSVIAGTFALEIKNMLDRLLNDMSDLWRLAALYGVAAAETADVEGLTGFQKAMNARWAEQGFVRSTGISAQMTNIRKEGNVIKAEVKARVKASQGQAGRFDYEVQFDTVEKQFKVITKKSVLEKTQKQEAVQPVSPVNTSTLRNLREEALVLPVVSEKPLGSTKELMEQATVLDFMVVPPVAPVPAEFRNAYRGLGALSSFGVELAVRSFEGGVPIEEAISEAGTRSELRKLQEGRIDQAISGLAPEEADRMKQLLDINMPGILIVPILNEDASVVSARLMAISEVARKDGMAVAVVGDLRSELRQAYGLTDDLLSELHIKLIQTAGRAAILKEITRLANRPELLAELFNKYVRSSVSETGGIISLNQTNKGQYLRVLIPQEEEQAALALKVPALLSEAENLERGGQIDRASAFAWVEILKLASLLKTKTPDEMMELKGGQLWGFKAGVAGLVSQLFKDYITIRRIATMA